MSAKILIVDDEEHFRDNIGSFLKNKGYEVEGVDTLAKAREALEQANADIILLDVQLPDGYGPNLLEETLHIPARPPIILITAYGEIEMAVDAMKNGALDFLQKPIELERLEQSVERAKDIVTLRREVEHYRESQRKSLDFVIGESSAMQGIISQAQRAASATVPILLIGPTGTGKEVLAHAIHQMGPRSKKPFIDINCAAIQPTMLESELFGHEKGAFTSADKKKSGLMEVADEGVLFLDEISSMPLEIQAKLLRAIEEQSFFRVGGISPIRVDVRIIAAANKDIEKMIEEGTFRDDLYYRLNVIQLHLPLLKERKQDIPELVGMFIRKLNPNIGTNIKDVSPRAMEVLMAYDWPGNIRDLKNAIESAMIFCDEPTIDLPHLPDRVTRVMASI